MLLLDMDKKVDLREYISTLQNGTHQAGLENNDFLGENESGPCRDRTDDPQIKSSSLSDHSMPE
jgi:hypothetical protein